MTVTAPKATSTDSRLDDLSEKVDAGFARVDADIRELRSDIKGVDAKFDGKFENLGSKIDRWTVGLLSATALGILVKFIN
jgi:hypothetical protein